MTLHIPNLASDVQTDAGHGIAPVASGPYRKFFKRFVDVSLVLLAAPIVFPMIGLLALAIALTGNMPFYSQLRLGKDGKPFRMWKLRTMVKNADAQLESYLKKNPAARQEWNTSQKLKNDPRITPFGRMLRKTSIDELPQLFNVLNGTMSLVGPRPMMVDQAPFYHGQAYYDMRPGITGLWQVSDRNDCSFAERVSYDNAYERVMSFKTDLRILWNTVGVVMRATGH